MSSKVTLEEVNSILTTLASLNNGNGESKKLTYGDSLDTGTNSGILRTGAMLGGYLGSWVGFKTRSYNITDFPPKIYRVVQYCNSDDTNHLSSDVVVGLSQKVEEAIKGIENVLRNQYTGKPEKIAIIDGAISSLANCKEKITSMIVSKDEQIRVLQAENDSNQKEIERLKEQIINQSQYIQDLEQEMVKVREENAFIRRYLEKNEGENERHTSELLDAASATAKCLSRLLVITKT